MFEGKDRDIEFLKSFVAQLSEHFDTVEIFVTKQDGENECTISVHNGCGNWFARYGQIKEWILKQEKMAWNEVDKQEEEKDDA